MAKGLRSKTKRHFKNIRRQEVFGPVEDARLARLAQKQADAALQEPITVHQPSTTPSDPEPTETDDRGRTPAETPTPNDTAMEVDSAAPSSAPMTKLEKERFMMTGNAFKKRQKARAKSLKRVAGGKVKKGPKGNNK